jgi:glycosyltransferase 2 family protein
MENSTLRGGAWKRIVQVFALAAVIWLLATRVHASDVVQAFARLKTGYLLGLVLVLSPLAILLRSIRWRYLLAEGKNIPLHSFVGAYLIGVLANSILLGKLGDFVKAKVLSHIQYERSVAVVIIDRLLEGIALVLIFVVVLCRLPLPGWAYRLAWLAGIGSIGALAVLRVLSERRQRLLSKAENAFHFVPASMKKRLWTIAHQLLSGCEVLGDYRRIAVALGWALCVWIVEIATVMVFLAAFSLPVPRFVAATVVLVVLNFGTLVPVSPGSLGVYQMLCVFALSFWGVDPHLGVAFGIAMQALLFIPLYLAGFIWLMVLTRGRNRVVRQEALAS